MRLIDADAIHYCEYDLDNYHWFRAAEEEWIAEMPTIDAVPVVRCKSCIHAKWSEQNKAYYCQRRWAMHKVRERDFCSYGERKDGEG